MSIFSAQDLQVDFPLLWWGPSKDAMKSPRDDSDMAEEQAAGRPLADAAGVSRPAHRVLIVDDHDPTRLALRKIIECQGLEVCEAATVAEGLAQLDQVPDCVVLDLALPDGCGETILRRIREEHLPIRTVAVTTGLYDPERLLEVHRMNPNVVIQKPIDPNVVWRLCEAEMAS